MDNQKAATRLVEGWVRQGILTDVPKRYDEQLIQDIALLLDDSNQELARAFWKELYDVEMIEVGHVQLS